MMHTIKKMGDKKAHERHVHVIQRTKNHNS